MCLYKRFNSYKFLCLEYNSLGTGDILGGLVNSGDWENAVTSIGVWSISGGGGGNSSAFPKGVAWTCARVEQVALWSLPFVVDVSFLWLVEVQEVEEVLTIDDGFKISSYSLSIFKWEKIKSYKDGWSGRDFLGITPHLSTCYDISTGKNRWYIPFRDLVRSNIQCLLLSFL